MGQSTNALENKFIKHTNDLELLIEAHHHDPFSILGRREYVQANNRIAIYTVFKPNKEKQFIRLSDNVIAEMDKLDGRGIFQWQGNPEALPYHPQVNDSESDLGWVVDPYSFLPFHEDGDLEKIGSTNYLKAYDILGAHVAEHSGHKGVNFCVWAPNAARVSVVGNFNHWDGRCHSMRCRGASGIWELFIPGIVSGELYKYEIKNRHSGELFVKTDPYGFYQEVRPSNASVIYHRYHFEWNDSFWLDRRRHDDWLSKPMSIYELHLGSWKKDDDNLFLSYRQIAHELLDYVKEMGFTHIQLLPMTEHPYDGSWGYQVTGYFAPTSRFGKPEDFKYFVNLFHEAGIGVLLDWVPAHFPKDDHGLARFDGTALYEHEDPRLGEHKDWGTLIFNYGRQEVINFLLSSAYFWLDEFHIDGLRVDAVASMLYLDYSKEEGEWLPNRYGGNENLEAIEFIKQLNMAIHDKFPGALVIAEESTSWPLVSRPVYVGGLGFSMKWNMGWMNDTLAYFHEDPVHRKYHHDKLTFSFLYAFSENFVLPFSHDEVVHGKQSMLDKMPGDAWQKFANLRLLYAYQYAHPGKKLMFMGDEIGQGDEWNEDRQIAWGLLQYGFQSGLQRLVKDLNRLYKNDSAFYRFDFSDEGFSWIDCHDNEQSVVSFYRTDGKEFIICVFNFTPIVRHDYRIGVPQFGVYEEIFNSDSEYYSGSNVSNGRSVACQEGKWQGQPYSISLSLPPLSGIYLKRKK